MKKTILLALVAGFATFARADENPPWATCACDEPAIVPAGTSWAGGELSFTNRAANGGASFDFAALDAAKFDGAKIRFVDGETKVDSLRFDPTRGLTFVGGAGTVLKGIADKSVFDGLGSYPLSPIPHPSTWSNLTFTCDATVRPVWRNGGAIAIKGGSFTIADCAFENCFSEEFGGAVYAPLLTDDSTITNCTFEGGWVSAYNGYGGAIYVSAAENGRKLVIFDSAFIGNEAVNGGAICTVRAADDQEIPIALVLSGTRFEDNAADYGGGAVFAEGAVTVADAADGVAAGLFAGNVAGYTGGAICVNGVEGVFVPVAVAVGKGATFVSNVVSNDYTWTAGGAIAVLTEGCTLDVSGALFETNRAISGSTADCSAFGGAVFASEDCTNRFYKTHFIGNAVRSGANACFGGALSLGSGRQTLDTCAFDCRTDELNDAVYGGAVDLDSSEDALLRNCTFRFAAVEAVSAYDVDCLIVSNCVAVGNGLVAPASYPDIYLDVCGRVEMSYSAYGSIWPSDGLDVDAFNLADRTTSIYAGADTLKLDAAGFNPVAGLGLLQPGVTDIVEVPYGSLPHGSSMGAYETPTEPLVVTLDGSKSYDGNTTSNGCTWTWTLGDTNGAARTWNDLLVPDDDTRKELHQVFSITNWAFAHADVGYYASTNATAATRIVAGLGSIDERVEWMRRILEFVYTGTISAAPSSDIVLIFDPAEYAWTGEAISPTNEPAGEVTVIVSNTLNGAILVRGVDYELNWRNNVNPTDAAKIDVHGINNYDGALIVSNYFITGYCTKYFQDVDTAHPVPYEVVTNGALSGDAVVAAIAVPAGYCLDWQWPQKTDHQTNGVVYVFGQGGTGKEDILTLYVDYEKDINVPDGDDVPDKYQERVVFAVVNGWWDDERNGADKIGWVTLYDSEGKWKTDGTGYLNSDALSAVPGVGDKPFGTFVTGEANGSWNQDLGMEITRSAFPIFLFSYGRDEKPSDPGRGDKPFRMTAVARNDVKSESPLQNALKITAFRVDGPDAVSGAAEAVVIDRASGKTLATTELSERTLTLYGAERPDGEWKPISNSRTDPNGGWSVNRLRSFKFIKAAIEE